MLIFKTYLKQRRREKLFAKRKDGDKVLLLKMRFLSNPKKKPKDENK